MLHEHSIVIHCSVQPVFAFMSDLEKLSKWRLDLPEYKIITPGPMIQGSRWFEYLNVMGQKLTSEVEVTSVETDHHFTTKIMANKIAYLITYQFEAIPEGTRLSIFVDADLPRVIKLIEPMIKHQIATSSARNLEHVKALLETPH